MNANVQKKIENFCEKNNLFRKGDGIVVGVSGGADSVFLFYFLVSVQEKLGLQLHVVHINHGIRGKEALHDEEYTKTLAKHFSISYTVYHEDIPKRAKEWKMTEEEAGRVYRYRCFEKKRKELGYQSIAVAHHQDDQAETVLFQMLRGSSLRGLGGMRPKRDAIIRPLLSVSRKEIEQELQAEGISYCMDATNEQDIYARNSIRHHLIPYMQQNLQPKAVEHIVQSSMHLQEVMQYIDGESDTFFQKYVKKGIRDGVKELVIEEKDFQSIASVLQKEIILKMLEEVAGQKKDITAVHVEDVQSIFCGGTGRKISLPYQMIAEKSYHRLLIYQDFKEEDVFFEKGEKIQLQREYLIPVGIQKKWKVTFCEKRADEIEKDNVKKFCTKCFDYDRMDTMPIFRYPQSGDFMWIDQTGHTKKLGRLFIDEKVPANEREKMWVLALEHHILWVPALGRCSAYYYLTDDTRNVLCAKIANNEG